MSPARKKVAVLGGGMGSLAAAWKLAKTGEYEITVYQRDHVLGGKGASVRNTREEFGQRIEEHGIHILMGWYENAVGLLKEVYDDLGGDPPDPGLGRVLPWDEVLLPHDGATMAESPELTGGDWEFWTVEFPHRRGFPGDGRGLSGIARLFVILLRWVARLRGHTFSGFAHAPAAPQVLQTFPYRPEKTDQEYADEDEQLTEEEAKKLLDSFQGMDVAEQLRTDAEALSMAVFGANDLGVFRSAGERRLRRVFMAYWFANTVATGLWTDRLFSRADFDRINDLEFRDWLRRHDGFPKASPLTKWDSPIVRILYDLSFGHGCDFAAGVWAWAVLLFAFAYKGSYVYKMNGGMGDIVFAPLYLALQKRGVQFLFFHDVEKLETDGEAITRIVLHDRAGFGESYGGLFGVPRDGHGLMPSWPDAPTAEIAPSQPKTLVCGQDFDEVVLGISVGGLDAVCGQLKANERFRAMLDSAATVATQAAQIWLRRDCRTVGWAADELVACFVRPFNSCVQMNHVLRSEPWRGDDGPAACVYLCDQAPNGATSDDVRASLEEFLERQGRRLFPQLAYDDLYDPLDRAGTERIDAQYWRANTVGSDRYVITPPGNPRLRLAPGDSGFRNLVLAGDWVTTDVNAGCLEAAVLGGLGAADALIRKG